MFSISLRGLLVWITWLAIVLLSLMYASELWVALVAGLAMLVFFGALAHAIAARGQRRAGAVVFCLTMAAYVWLVLNIPVTSVRPTRTVELDQYDGRLPTTQLLRFVHQTMDRSGRIRLNNGVPIRITPQGTTIFSGPQSVTYSEIPPVTEFMVVGHLWWALLLGCIAGRYAQWIYLQHIGEPENINSG